MQTFANEKLRELISKKELEKRVSELGKEITEYYEKFSEPLVLVGILKGSIIFLSDLCRAIDLPLEMELIGASSYGSGTKSSGQVSITNELTGSIKNKHVLIVEDIFETGLTLEKIIDTLGGYEPKSIKVCSLLRKTIKNQKDIAIDFVGFDIPNDFVVGYGLDVAERLRNLSAISIYEGQ